jgi:hypothetical protein
MNTLATAAAHRSPPDDPEPDGAPRPVDPDRGPTPDLPPELSELNGGVIEVENNPSGDFSSSHLI